MMTTPSTITYRRGDIVLVSFPFTDLTLAKRRPALVVSPDIFNELNQDLILLAVTSQLSRFPHSIPVSPCDCDEGALPKESMVGLTKVFTLSCTLERSPGKPEKSVFLIFSYEPNGPSRSTQGVRLVLQ